MDTTVQVATLGEVSATEVTRVARALTRVLRRHRVTSAARVRISAPPCADGPVLVQANIRFREQPARVQVGGPRGFAAAFAAERLDRQLARLADVGEPRLWPDPARPALAMVGEPRPIVRRKHAALQVGGPAAATRTMDAMDYDAHLFVDDRTGADAVVHWAAPSGVRLVRQAPQQDSSTVSNAAPRLTEREAAARLCLRGVPFLFFTDPVSGRGRLLYRRYDGDLAMVLPTE